MFAGRFGNAAERDGNRFPSQLVDGVVPERNVHAKVSLGGLCLSDSLFQQLQIPLEKGLPAGAGGPFDQIGLDVVVNSRESFRRFRFPVVTDDVVNSTEHAAVPLRQGIGLKAIESRDSHTSTTQSRKERSQPVRIKPDLPRSVTL